MQPKVFIYLAGSIMGCDVGEARDWRIRFKRDLESIGIRGIDPLRCEPLIGDRYGAGYPADPRFGTPRAIKAKNLMDVKGCDLTLAYFDYDLTERAVSLGTICELAWAHALGKPVICVSTHPRIVEHPVINASVDWMLGTLEEAFETIEGLFSDYIHWGLTWRG